MDIQNPPQVIWVKAQGSELHKFALIYGQDFQLIFSDFDTAAQGYIVGLPPGRSSNLREEIRQLIASNDDDLSLKRAWIAQGAQWLPEAFDLRAALKNVIAYLSTEH